MTTPTFLEQSGISLSVWNPIINMSTPLYTPRGTLVSDTFFEDVAGYQHQILADGGWWSASISLSTSLDVAEDWFELGLNRHIEVYNAAADRIWAGFVNQVTVSAGTVTAVRGPLMDIVNRCSVVYTPILDPTTVPPTEGTETTTTLADDATSQSLYGVLEDVVSGGKLLDDGTTDDAVTLRDTYIQENKDAQTSEDLDLVGGQAASVQLDLLGYVHRLQKYVYQDATSATQQVDAKIQAVFAADPNGLFSTDYTRIGANATLASRSEDDNRMAWDVLTQEVALGDAASNRYVLGVYANQQVVYGAIPTAAEYQHSIIENESRIEPYGGGAWIPPYNVQPAKWLFLYDFLARRGLPGTLRDDPRFLFIEAVTYTAPTALQISGQKVSQLPQLIARLSG